MSKELGNGGRASSSPSDMGLWAHHPWAARQASSKQRGRGPDARADLLTYSVSLYVKRRRREPVALSPCDLHLHSTFTLVEEQEQAEGGGEALEGGLAQATEISPAA